jgi:hypothetical protein
MKWYSCTGSLGMDPQEILRRELEENSLLGVLLVSKEHLYSQIPLKEMKKRAQAKKLEDKVKVNKWIYWIPRILSILFILFLALFSLDVFESASGFWQIVLALLMHNIPTIILVIILIISWKYEIVGGIIFILAGLAYFVRTFIVALMNKEFFMLFWFAPISVPAFLIGVLFLIGWYKKRKNKIKK